MTRIAFIISITVLIAQSAFAEEFSAKVVGVTDGDTLTALADNREVKIRLAGIDAPEKRQPFGMASKKHLSDLVYGQTITLNCTKADRYRRLICVVKRNGQDINLLQVSSGVAWWYRQYAREQSVPDRSAYAGAEDEARLARRGLWAEPNPVPPWDWRRR